VEVYERETRGGGSGTEDREEYGVQFTVQLVCSCKSPSVARGVISYWRCVVRAWGGRYGR
jgi:hypothetical protein